MFSNASSIYFKLIYNAAHEILKPTYNQLKENRVLSSAENSKSVRHLYLLNSQYRKIYFAGFTWLVEIQLREFLWRK